MGTRLRSPALKPNGGGPRSLDSLRRSSPNGGCKVHHGDLPQWAATGASWFHVEKLEKYHCTFLNLPSTPRSHRICTTKRKMRNNVHRKAKGKKGKLRYVPGPTISAQNNKYGGNRYLRDRQRGGKHLQFFERQWGGQRIHKNKKCTF